MPLHYNLQVEIFDVWGIDFMGPFQKTYDSEYILITVDHVLKWVKALPCMQSRRHQACNEDVP